MYSPQFPPSIFIPNSQQSAIAYVVDTATPSSSQASLNSHQLLALAREVSLQKALEPLENDLIPMSSLKRTSKPHHLKVIQSIAEKEKLIAVNPVKSPISSVSKTPIQSPSSFSHFPLLFSRDASLQRALEPLDNDLPPISITPKPQNLNVMQLIAENGKLDGMSHTPNEASGQPCTIEKSPSEQSLKKIDNEGTSVSDFLFKLTNIHILVDASKRKLSKLMDSRYLMELGLKKGDLFNLFNQEIDHLNRLAQSLNNLQEANREESGKPFVIRIAVELEETKKTYYKQLLRSKITERCLGIKEKAKVLADPLFFKELANKRTTFDDSKKILNILRNSSSLMQLGLKKGDLSILFNEQIDRLNGLAKSLNALHALDQDDNNEPFIRNFALEIEETKHNYWVQLLKSKITERRLGIE